MNNQQQAMVDGPQNNKKSMKQRASGVFGVYWRTACLPGIGPRLKTLGARFGHFAYLLAMIYGAVRLIKPEHPVLNPANIGKFGFRDVISAAAENVVVSRQTIDQVLIFGAVIFGLIAIVVQIGLIVLWAGMEFYAGTAQAQEIGSLFETPNPTSDLALIFIDSVFGTGVFGTEMTGTPFHAGLHAMLAMFSMAMLVIAIFILIYFIFVVVGEAAITGTPFGKRFNGFYAPIRLVLAFGLLIPLANGLNTAQYATLYVAKMGSGMATQAWRAFSKGFLEPTDIIASPSISSLEQLVSDLFVSEMCMYSYNEGGNKSKAKQVKRIAVMDIPEELADVAKRSGAKVEGRIFSSKSQYFKEMSSPAQIAGLLDYLPQMQTGKIEIRYSNKKHANKANRFCGAFEINLAKASRDDRADAVLGIFGVKLGNEDKAKTEGDVLRSIQVSYLHEMVNIISQINTGRAEGSDKTYLEEIVAYADSVSDEFGEEDVPYSEAPLEWINSAAERVIVDMEEAQEALNKGKDALVFEDMVHGGWAVAPSWFHSIARLNAKYIDMVNNARPKQTSIPKIMDHLFIDEDDKKQTKARKRTKFSENQARIMEVGVAWFDNGGGNIRTGRKGNGVDLFTHFLANTLGGGISDFRKDATANPLAELSAIGTNLIYRSIAGLAILVGVNVIWTDWVGLDGLTMILSMFISVGLGAGFTLAYILPLTPYMYFLFAVSGWVSEIFEAIVAMPLWALAHLRIDGDGLMGGAATGYQLLFGIFTRPIFIVFGLIGGYLVFTSSIALLNVTFSGAASGGNIGFIDPFFYTIVYVIIAYNLAMTSFKLIDAVPNQILRWMGLNAQGFNDGRENPLKDVGQATAVAGAFIGQQGASAAGGMGKAGGHMARGRMSNKDVAASQSPDLSETVGKTKRT